MNETEKNVSSRVQRKRDERRERIVEAAFRAVSERGPADFSLNQLARDLDYTPGALYWYFPSKEALVLEIQSRAFSQLAVMLREARERWRQDESVVGRDEPTRLLHTLLCQARWYLQLDKVAPEYTRIISFSLDPRILLNDEQAQDLMTVLAALFVESSIAFNEAQGAGLLTEAIAMQRTIQYWAALHGMVSTSKLARLNPGLFQVESLGMNSAEALLIGWGAPAAALAAAKECLASTAP